jgi:predicted nucleotidyltransferase component of viral defense system
MIKDHCFTDEWFNSFKQQAEHSKIDKIILEKMIYALHLLERLEYNNLDFVFKSGTSLVLLLKESKRFSIDIDIISTAKKEDLESIINKIIEDSKFSRWELQEHRSYKKGVPKAHYKFIYDSKKQGSGTILLDILIEKSLYPEHVDISIDNKWIETDKDTLVKAPSIDSITGDKLTAFAPNTIGIPYFKSEKSTSMEIIKQLFDLSSLFEKIEKFNIVANTYQLFAKKGIEYRGNDFKIKDALLDTINTCLIIAKRGRGTDDEKRKFIELQKGIKSFGTGYLMSGVFRLDNALAASSRIAYVVAKILANDLSLIEYYNDESINELTIENQQWGFINKLKKLPDKSSYFYFHKVCKIMDTIK